MGLCVCVYPGGGSIHALDACRGKTHIKGTQPLSEDHLHILPKVKASQQKTISDLNCRARLLEGPNSFLF